MRTLVLKIAEKFCETLSAGVIGEPKWKECLALIDAELNLDASFLLLDRNRGDDVELVDTTTNKLSTFSGDSSDQFSLEGPFLSEVSKAKVWGWHPLERTRFLDDPLWELLWITMNLGAYSGPHTVCAISLPGSTHNNDTSGGNTHNNDTSGVIILFMPADYIGENSKEWPECASLLAHTFSVAALCSSAQRLAQARLAHNECAGAGVRERFVHLHE